MNLISSFLSRQVYIYLNNLNITISCHISAIRCNHCHNLLPKKSVRQVGISMSAAFTIFAKKVGRERRIPFEVSADPFYSESNIRYLENIVRDIKEGKAHFAEHDLIEVDE